MVLLVAAWRVAGYLGADAFLLHKLGTVCEPGTWTAKVLHPRHA
jgi:hypothetical protein